MRKFVSILLCFLIFVPSHRAAGSGIPVVDVAAIAQLVSQVNNTLEMISQLNTLTEYADLDHEALATKKFKRWFNQYTKIFEDIMKQVEGYQNMFDQISRLDEVYFHYHTDWEKDSSPEEDELNNLSPEEKELTRKLKKQVLWTRIQMKHAAKVGAAVKDTLRESQDELEGLLDDNKQSAGTLLALQIGNQLTGTVGKNLQTLNLQMNEFLQAFSAKNLEENHMRGLKMNRYDDVMKNFLVRPAQPEVPLNPIGAF